VHVQQEKIGTRRSCVAVQVCDKREDLFAIGYDTEFAIYFVLAERVLYEPHISGVVLR
jgi:hypothetical protein